MRFLTSTPIIAAGIALIWTVIVIVIWRGVPRENVGARRAIACSLSLSVALILYIGVELNGYLSIEPMQMTPLPGSALAKSEQSGKTSEIILQIQADGTVRLDDTAVLMSGLSDALKVRLRLHPDTMISIKADQKTSYAATNLILNILAKSGVKNNVTFSVEDSD